MNLVKVLFLFGAFTASVVAQRKAGDEVNPLIGKWNCSVQYQGLGYTGSLPGVTLEFRDGGRFVLISGKFAEEDVNPSDLGAWSGGLNDLTVNLSYPGFTVKGKAENGQLKIVERDIGIGVYDLSCRRVNVGGAATGSPERTFRFLNDRLVPVVLQVLDGSVPFCGGDVVAQETLEVQSSKTVACALGKDVGLCYRFKQNDETNFGSSYGVSCMGNDPLGTVWGKENQKLIRLSGVSGTFLLDLHPRKPRGLAGVTISGSWRGSGGEYAIEQTVDSLSITGGVYGPASGSFTGPYSITVTWPQVNATYTGTVLRNADGYATRIVWDHPANNYWDR
jgi:hypothetical protein